MSAPLWMRIALGVSLSLNLLVVGIIAGAAWRHGGGPGPRAGVDFALPYVRALDRNERRAIARAVRAGRQGAPMGRAARTVLYAQVVATLRADPFDAAALERLVSAQAVRASEVQAAAQAAWLDVVGAMSDDERAAYADRVDTLALRRGKPGPDR